MERQGGEGAVGEDGGCVRWGGEIVRVLLGLGRCVGDDDALGEVLGLTLWVWEMGWEGEVRAAVSGLAVGRVRSAA